jgi:prostaglandin-H2 D-isomerase / glutathione transferase
MTTKMKLVYFNGRGLAETSRLLLAINKAEYEDFRYPLKIIDWATHNMEREEFLQDKKENKLVQSLNKVPFLEVNGQVLSQSKSIERYLATTFNMMGDTPLEAARIDSLAECVRDFKDAYQSVRKLPEDEKEAGMKKWFSETLVERFELLENLLCKEHEHFSVGRRMSLADVVLFAFITQFFDNTESAWNATSTTPKLRAIIEHLQMNKELQHWLKTRPETPF